MMEIPNQYNPELNVDSRALSEIEPTDFSRSTIICDSEHLKRLIEAPLIPACEILYQKNIETLDSTANRKNVEHGGTAGIAINWQTLSEENRRIAESLGLKPAPYDDTEVIEIQESINDDTTVSELAEKFAITADKFLKQEPSWIPSWTMAEMKNIYGIPQEEECAVQDFDQYYFDAKTDRFYLSEDHARKIKQWQE